MKKIAEKILILLLVLMLISSVMELNYSFAAEASISVPSTIYVGDTFTITVNIPSDAIGYEGKISVALPGGTTQNSGKLTKVTGVEGEYTHPGNMTFSVKSEKEGEATITVSELVIPGINGQLNANETLTKKINITVKPAPAPEPEPTTPAPAPSTPEPAPSTPSNEPGWTATGDTVYALEKLNVRESWSSSSNKLGQLKKGTSTKRIAVGSNGWDKIEYNGKTAYVMSKYLTTKNPNAEETEQPTEPTWQDTGDKVYAIKSINVREGWGTTFKIVGGLQIGDSVTRVSVGSNGWDKIKYEGKTAYVMSKYLSTEEPEIEEEEENTEVNNTTENTNVTENTITNEEIYNTIIDEVGVIPPVGKNIADYIYVIAVGLAIGMVAFIGLKIRENDKE